MKAPSGAPRVRWYVYSGPDDNGRLYRIPHTATMRGHWPGWDATCPCGWDSQTGGATRGYIKTEVFLHKIVCPLRPDSNKPRPADTPQG